MEDRGAISSSRGVAFSRPSRFPKVARAVTAPPAALQLLDSPGAVLEATPSWWSPDGSHYSAKHAAWLPSSPMTAGTGDPRRADLDRNMQALLRLIQEDAELFGQRAERYNEDQPALIKLVDQFNGAYRALADRYDLVAGEQLMKRPSPKTPGARKSLQFPKQSPAQDKFQLTPKGSPKSKAVPSPKAGRSPRESAVGVDKGQISPAGITPSSSPVQDKFQVETSDAAGRNSVDEGTQTADFAGRGTDRATQPAVKPLPSSSTESDLESQKVESLTHELSDLNRELARFQEENAKLKQEVSSGISEVAELRTQLSGLQEMNVSLTSGTTSLSAEIHKLQEQVFATSTESTRYRIQLSSAEQDLEKHRAVITGEADQRISLSTALEDTRASLSLLQSTHEDLSKQKDNVQLLLLKEEEARKRSETESHRLVAEKEAELLRMQQQLSEERDSKVSVLEAAKKGYSHELEKNATHLTAKETELSRALEGKADLQAQLVRLQEENAKLEVDKERHLFSLQAEHTRDLKLKETENAGLKDDIQRYVSALHTKGVELDDLQVQMKKLHDDKELLFVEREHQVSSLKAEHGGILRLREVEHLGVRDELLKSLADVEGKHGQLVSSLEEQLQLSTAKDNQIEALQGDKLKLMQQLSVATSSHQDSAKLLNEKVATLAHERDEAQSLVSQRVAELTSAEQQLQALQDEHSKLSASKEAEIYALHEQGKKLRAELVDVTGSLASFKEDSSTLLKAKESKHDQVQAEFKRLMSQKQEEYGKLELAMASVEEGRTKLSLELLTSDQQISHLHKEIDEHRLESESIVRKLREELANKENELADKEKLWLLKDSEASSRHDELRQQLVDKDQELGGVVEQHRNIQSDKAASLGLLQQEIASLKAEIQDLQSKYLTAETDFQHRVKTFEKDILVLRGEKESDSLKLKELLKTIAMRELDLQNAKKEESLMVQRIDETKSVLLSQEAEVEKMQDERAKYVASTDGQFRTLNAEIDRLQNDLTDKTGIVTELNSTVEELRKAILQFEVVKSEHALAIASITKEKEGVVVAKEADICRLKQNHERTLKAKEMEMLELLDEQKNLHKVKLDEVSALQSERELLKGSHQQEISKLSREHAKTSAARDASAALIAQQIEQLKVCDVQISQLKDESHQLRDELKERELALLAIREEKERLRVISEANVATLRKQLYEKEAELSNLGELLKIRESESAKSLEATQVHALATEAALTSLKAEIQERDSKYKLLIAERDGLKDELSKLGDDMQNRLLEKEAELKRRQEEIFTLSNSHAQASRQREADSVILQEQIRQLKGEISSLQEAKRKTSAEVDEQLSVLRSDLSRLQEERDKLVATQHQEADDHKHILAARDVEIAQLTKNYASLQEVVKEQELSMATIREEREATLKTKEVDISALKATVQEKDARYLLLVEERDGVKEELSRLGNDTQKQLLEKEGELKRRQQEISTLSDAHSQASRQREADSVILQEQIRQLKGEISSLQEAKRKTSAEVDEQLSVLRSDLSRLQEERDKLVATQHQEADDHKHILAARDVEIAQLTKNYASLQEAVKKQELSMATIREEREATLKTKEVDISALKATVQEKDARYLLLVEERDGVKEELSRLGNDTQKQLLEKEGELKRRQQEISTLSDSHSKYSRQREADSVILQEQMKQLKGEISSLQEAKRKTSEEVDEQLSVLRSDLSRLQEERGELVATLHQEADDHKHLLAARDVETAQLTKNYASLQEVVKEQELSMATIRGEREATLKTKDVDISALKATVQEKDAKYLVLVEASNRFNASKEEELSTLKHAMEELRREKESEVTRIKEEMSTVLSAHAQVSREKDAHAASLQEKIEKLKGDINSLQEIDKKKVGEHSFIVSGLLKDISALQEDRGKLVAAHSREAQDQMALVTARTDEVTSLRNSLKEHESAVAKARDEKVNAVKSMDLEIASLRKQTQGKEAELEKLKQLLALKESEIVKIVVENEELLQAKEVEIGRLDTQLKTVIKEEKARYVLLTEEINRVKEFNEKELSRVTDESHNLQAAQNVELTKIKDEMSKLCFVHAQVSEEREAETVILRERATKLKNEIASLQETEKKSAAEFALLVSGLRKDVAALEKEREELVSAYSQLLEKDIGLQELLAVKEAEYADSLGGKQELSLANEAKILQLDGELKTIISERDALRMLQAEDRGRLEALHQDKLSTLHDETRKSLADKDDEISRKHGDLVKLADAYALLGKEKEEVSTNLEAQIMKLKSEIDSVLEIEKKNSTEAGLLASGLRREMSLVQDERAKLVLALSQQTEDKKALVTAREAEISQLKAELLLLQELQTKSESKIAEEDDRLKVKEAAISYLSDENSRLLQEKASDLEKFRALLASKQSDLEILERSHASTKAEKLASVTASDAEIMRLQRELQSSKAEKESELAKFVEERASLKASNEAELVRIEGESSKVLAEKNAALSRTEAEIARLVDIHAHVAKEREAESLVLLEQNKKMKDEIHALQEADRRNVAEYDSLVSALHQDIEKRKEEMFKLEDVVLMEKETELSKKEDEVSQLNLRYAQVLKDMEAGKSGFEEEIINLRNQIVSLQDADTTMRAESHALVCDLGAERDRLLLDMEFRKRDDISKLSHAHAQTLNERAAVTASLQEQIMKLEVEVLSLKEADMKHRAECEVLISGLHKDAESMKLSNEELCKLKDKNDTLLKEKEIELRSLHSEVEKMTTERKAGISSLMNEKGEILKGNGAELATLIKDKERTLLLKESEVKELQQEVDQLKQIVEEMKKKNGEMKEEFEERVRQQDEKEQSLTLQVNEMSSLQLESKRALEDKEVAISGLKQVETELRKEVEALHGLHRTGSGDATAQLQIEELDLRDERKKGQVVWRRRSVKPGCCQSPLSLWMCFAATPGPRKFRS